MMSRPRCAAGKVDGFSLSLHDLQPQHLLKRIKVVVAMQQLVSSLQTKSSDETINGLAHCVTTLPQVAIVLGRGDGQVRSAGLEYMKLQQFVPYLRKKSAVWNTLQNLAEDEIGQPQSLRSQFPFQPMCLWILGAA
jgi:hypothetical protein